MLVGFMDPAEKPPLIAKVTSVMSSYYGVDIIYFRPWDVDMENGTVDGSMYKNKKWVPVKKSLPKLIDATSKSFNRETKDIMAYLRQNTVLTFDKKSTPNKEKLQKKLSKDSKFAHLVIPTEPMDSFETLESFLNKYSAIVMKPITGKKGMDVYSLYKKEDDSYTLGYKTEEKELNRDELFEFYQEFLTDQTYILQKLIESRTITGDPFDCRIVVQKNGEGKWVTAKIIIRVGTGQKIVSNISQGGYIIDPKSFLETNFGDQGESIYRNLKEIGKKLPYKIEKIKKTPTMDLGLDIGIEKNGDLFLFEVNNGASIKLIISESAMFRLQYYHHIFDTHPDLKNISKIDEKKETVSKLKKQIKRLRKKNKLLAQECDQLKKEVAKIKQSKTWRFTTPIRKLNVYLKKR